MQCHSREAESWSEDGEKVVEGSKSSETQNVPTCLLSVIEIRNVIWQEGEEEEGQMYRRLRMDRCRFSRTEGRPALTCCFLLKISFTNSAATAAVLSFFHAAAASWPRRGPKGADATKGLKIIITLNQIEMNRVPTLIYVNPT